MRYPVLLLIVVFMQLVGCQATPPVKPAPAKVELVSAIDTQPPARGFGSNNPANDSQSSADSSTTVEKSSAPHKARKGKSGKKSSKLSKKKRSKSVSKKARRGKSSKRRVCR